MQAREFVLKCSQTSRSTPHTIEFVKAHPQLYAKENDRYMDKTHKDALWDEFGEQFGQRKKPGDGLTH